MRSRKYTQGNHPHDGFRDHQFTDETDEDLDKTFNKLVVPNFNIGLQLLEEILRPLNGTCQQFRKIAEIQRDFHKIVVGRDLLAVHIHQIRNGLQGIKRNADGLQQVKGEQFVCQTDPQQSLEKIDRGLVEVFVKQQNAQIRGNTDPYPTSLGGDFCFIQFQRNPIIDDGRGQENGGKGPVPGEAEEIRGDQQHMVLRFFRDEVIDPKRSQDKEKETVGGDGKIRKKVSHWVIHCSSRCPSSEDAAGA